MKAVHAGWLEHTKPKLRTPLRSGMASSIRARLSDGFSVEDLVLVAEWAANDPWMSGKHEKNKQPYLGVATLYRSTDKTAGYLQRAEAWVRAGKPKNGGVYDRKALHLSSTAKVTSVEWF